MPMTQTKPTPESYKIEVFTGTHVGHFNPPSVHEVFDFGDALCLAMEHAADEDIAQGNVHSYKDVESMLTDLEKLRTGDH